MRLIILGAGGYGRTIADMAEQNGQYDTILFLDDKAKSAAGECSVYKLFDDGNTEYYPAFGNNEIRLAWIERLISEGCRLAKIIHPSAYVSPRALVEPGVAVLPHAVINTGSTVCKGGIVNCGAIIDRDCMLEQGVHVCLGAIIKADNHIPRCTKIEAGETVVNGRFSVSDGLE